MRRLLLPLLAILFGASLLGVLLLWDPAGDEHQDRLSLTETPTGGEFTLQSYAGPVSLESLRGKVVVLYFGYTWCPDVCPTSLGFLSVALNEMKKDELALVQGLFISVDPERDSVARLKEYGAYFHTNILGITGSPAQLRQLATRYGAAFHKGEADDRGNYAVDHSADLYLIDSRGTLAARLPHGTEPQKILASIRDLLPEHIN